ncbi:hypothetical protein BDV98DRAFT_597219 [Pterulicium gracile]|uniref:AB hydrolase-1 domain-containing protein n=1 Tax=Pterulicium gracile TaxID=1884261 RepID=A0A5C3Q8X9_9AGAR|nr:hypothetical protein BDV98DRAFT_597219 [Pterula gracilis]
MFWTFYLVRSYGLQKAALHPEIPDRASRRELLHRCATEVPSGDVYRGWFSSGTISRAGVKEWLLWGFFSCPPHEALGEWAEELDEYVDYLEETLGLKYEEEDVVSTSMRITLDPVMTLHRPLVWYLIVFFVDAWTSSSLRYTGFRPHNTMGWFSAFPPRPLTFFGRPTPVQDASYWYKPHTSTTKLPIVFIHGIGIGLWPYIPFLKGIIAQDPTVGILLIEIVPITMHISHRPPPAPLTVQRIASILAFHSIDRFVLAAHSYGTVVSTHLLHSELTAPLISSVLFIDPIPFLLHLPDVAFNFVYRSPRTANEWQLWYFASRDPDIARALSRHFFWQKNVLWKDEVRGMIHEGGKRFAVVLSGEDQIVNAEMVRRYLTGEEERREYWRGEGGGLEVIWEERADHATVLDTEASRRPMLDVLGRFVEGQ